MTHSAHTSTHKTDANAHADLELHVEISHKAQRSMMGLYDRARLERNNAHASHIRCIDGASKSAVLCCLCANDAIHYCTKVWLRAT